MTRSVFYGFGAFVGSITGPTTCGWWADDPVNLAWDHAKLVSTDLSKNPEAARRGLVAVGDIQVDDYAGYAFGGLTQIGPMWPGGKMLGAIYLEENFWNGLGANKPPRVPAGMHCHDYELCSVLYWDGDLAGRRFNGYYAQIVGTAKSGLPDVAIYPRGSSQRAGQLPLGTWPLDLATQALPIEPGFTQIGTAPGDPKSGALFLDAQTSSALGIGYAIKRPWYYGGALAPRQRGRRARRR